MYHHSHYEKLGYEKGLCPNAEKFYNEVMSARCIGVYNFIIDNDWFNRTGPFVFNFEHILFIF